MDDQLEARRRLAEALVQNWVSAARNGNCPTELLALIASDIRAGLPITGEIGSWLADALSAIAEGQNAAHALGTKRRVRGKVSGKNWRRDFCIFVEVELLREGGRCLRGNVSGEGAYEAVAEKFNLSEKQVERIHRANATLQKIIEKSTTELKRNSGEDVSG